MRADPSIAAQFAVHFLRRADCSSFRIMRTTYLHRLSIAVLSLASSGVVTTGCVVHENPGPTRAEIKHEDRAERREEKREDKEEKREERHDDDYR